MAGGRPRVLTDEERVEHQRASRLKYYLKTIDAKRAYGREHMRKKRRERPEHVKALKRAWNASPKGKAYARRARLLRVYGITPEQFDQMLGEQGGVCAICKRPFDPSRHGMKLHIDHDHRTGMVRGLLHNNCNVGLGSFDDDADRLVAAAEYLRRKGGHL